MISDNLWIYVIIFLTITNAAPLYVGILFGTRYSFPADFQLIWTDGFRFFGENKTLRGLAAMYLGGLATIPLIQLSLTTTLIATTLVMFGDLITSFIKRRMVLKSGASVFGLDHVMVMGFPTVFFIGIGLHATEGIGVLLLMLIIGHFGSLLTQTHICGL